MSYARDSLARFNTIEEVAVFAIALLHSIIPADKVALAIIEGNVLRSVSTMGKRVIMDLNLDWSSVNARTVKTMQTQLVNDTEKDPDYFPGNGDDSFTMLSELCVPLIHRGLILGTINFENQRSGQFSDDDVEVAEVFAAEIAEALHRVLGRGAPEKFSQDVYQARARSTVEMYHDLLRAVHEGETVLNRILNKTRIHWVTGKGMVNDLIDKGYLVRERLTGRRYVYRISEAGVKALKTCEGIVEIFKK